MPVESTAQYVNDLVASNPLHSDGVNQGDSHIRLIKSVLQATFPMATGPIGSWAAVAKYGTSTGSTVPGVQPSGTDATAGLAWSGTPGVMNIIGTLTGDGAVPTGSVHAFLLGTSVVGTAAAPNTAGTYTDATQYLRLDGGTYPQSRFPRLAALYGASSGTFTVHNLASTGMYLRQATSAFGLGTYQPNTLLNHTHGATSASQSFVGDGGHNHGVLDFGHNHGVSDPGHSHSLVVYGNVAGPTFAQNIAGQYYNPAVVGTSGSGTGIGLFPSITGIQIQPSGSNISVVTNTQTAIAAGGGGTETRPETIVVWYCIKT